MSSHYRQTPGNRGGSAEYYQVGGYNGIQGPGNTPKWGQEGPLAQALLGPNSPLRQRDSDNNPTGPVELVLGIKRAGASHILLTAAEAFDYTLVNRLRPPNRANALRPDDFESLSPITFDSADELKKRLKNLSKDNNPYRDQHRDAGSARGQFELNRVFYRLVQPHSTLDLAKYSLPRDLQLPPTARILALTFNVWSLKFDTRAESERLRNPRILDVAFAEVDVPSFGLKVGSVQHCVLSENSGFIRDRPRESFEHLIQHKDVIGQRISKFLSQGPGPNILLVYDKVATEYVLEAVGCEFKGQTIRSLLPLDNTTYSSYDQRKNRNRSRSRSPTRPSSSSTTRDPRRPPKREESTTNSRRQDQDTTSSTAGRQNVIIDAHNLFFTMMAEGERPGSSRPTGLSARLGISQVPKDGEWGAARDARLLVEVWKAMASGPTIDEQRATWPSRAASAAANVHNTQLAAPGPGPGPSEEDEDFDPEDMDPNDYRPPVSSVPAAASGYAAGGAQDDSDSDYDSDEY